MMHREFMHRLSLQEIGGYVAEGRRPDKEGESETNGLNLLISQKTEDGLFHLNVETVSLPS